MADLLLLTGPEKGQRFPLLGDRISLGRDPKCGIVIKETLVSRDLAPGDFSNVSRKHAVIVCEGDRYYIEDGDGQGNNSRNGVYVNEFKAPLTGRIRLRSNDRIRICSVAYTFLVDESTFSVEESIDHGSGLETQPADKLRIILEISNSLSQALEIDRLLPRIVDHLFQLFPQAERGFIILRDEGSGALVPRVAKTRQTGDEPVAGFSSTIVNRCLDNMKAILANDIGQEFSESASIAGLPIRSLMCAPLFTVEGQPLGAIQLDLDGPKKKFTREDLNLLLGVASQASIALNVADLHRDALINQRRVRDLELARQVQASLQPHDLPTIPGYAFFAHCESALEVGGDYYDFIRLPRQRLGALLGDVAGKGVAAALIMVKFSVEMRVCLLNEADLPVAVSMINALMSQVSLTDRFVTLVAAVLDPATHTATLVNAGHPWPLLFHHATGAVQEAGPNEVKGPPIGVADSHQYECCQVPLQPGNRLLLFSDGVTDALNAQNRSFGEKGVRTALGGEPCSPRDTGERLIKALKQHASGCSQNDDITFVCLGRDVDCEGANGR
jgi:sigma-B regulation protein RsbU (phosphoserine phosphatase)